MSIYMTGSYFHKKIILIVALAAFLVGGFIPMNIVNAAQNAPTAAEYQAAIDFALKKPTNRTLTQEDIYEASGFSGFKPTVQTSGKINTMTGKPEKTQAEILATLKAGKPVPQKNDEIYCFDFGGKGLVGARFSLYGCMAMGAFKILQVSAFVLWAAAAIFDNTINYTLNMAAFIKDIPIVDLGWSVFRDVTNLLFIFIILYIAINTIIGNEGYGIKKLLGKVIVGAMLINFSLFFTQAMIDVSNIFALQFYHKITQDTQAANTAAGESKSNTNLDGGISAGLVNAMGLQQLLQIGVSTKNGGLSKESTGDNLNASGLGLNAGNLMLVALGGTGFITITAFVFFAGAMMLLVRTIVLIFLMILSPIAFMGNILPALGKYTGEWWSKLTSNLLFAPVYMMLLYLVMSMVTSDAFKQVGGVAGANGKKTANFASLFAGGDNWIPTIMTFVVLIMLMVGCLIIASKLGVYGGKWAEKTGMGLATGLGMSLSGAGLARYGFNTGVNTVKGAGSSVGRQTAGWVGDKISKSPHLAKLSTGKFGKLAAYTMQKGDSLKDAKIGGKSFNEEVKSKQKDYTKRGNLIEAALGDEGVGEKPKDNATKEEKKIYNDAKAKASKFAAETEAVYLGKSRFSYVRNTAIKKAAKAAKGTNNKEALQSLIDGKYSRENHDAAKELIDGDEEKGTLGLSKEITSIEEEILGQKNQTTLSSQITPGIGGGRARIIQKKSVDSEALKVLEARKAVLLSRKIEAQKIVDEHLKTVEKISKLD